MKKKVMIVGPYGGKNLGDDLILYEILESLAAFDVDVMVSCSDPDAVAKVFDVPTCPLLEYRRREVESLRLIPDMDAVIIGGGEQLSEPRIINPIWGHLARTAHICRVARRAKVPVMLWAVGLDELRSGLSRFLLRRWLFRDGVVACLRDEASVKRAERIMAPGFKDLHLVADPAYALEPLPRRSLPEEERTRLGIAEDAGRRILVVPAYDNLISLDYVDTLADFCRSAAGKGLHVYGWTTDLQPGYDDTVIGLPVWDDIPGFSWIERKYIHPKDMAAFVGEFDLVVSARMHPIIVAQTQGVRSFVMARSAKMVAMLDRFSIDGSRIEELTLQALLNVLDKEPPETGRDFADLSRVRKEALISRQIFADWFGSDA